MARIEDFRVRDRTWVAGDYFHDLWKKEVGDGRLPEILRSGVRAMRRFPDAPDSTTNAYVRCGNDAQCNGNVYKPSNSNAYYTSSTQYESNTSQRRQLHSQKGLICTGNATASQDLTEGIGPFREHRNSWKDLQDLSHTLLFETLRLMLLVSITVVQVSVTVVKLSLALAEGISWWLDEEMLRIPRLIEHKEGWMCTEDQSSGEQDLKEDKKPSANMNSDPDSSLSPLPAMATMLCMPMPPPGTPGSPMFEDANVTEFLERYEDLCSDYHVSDKDKLARLPRYAIQPIRETIKSLKEWKEQDYAALRKALLAEYKENDIRQLLYSVPFLESYKSITRTEKDDILDYCRKFDRIAQHCIDKKVLTEYTAGI